MISKLKSLHIVTSEVEGQPDLVGFKYKSELIDLYDKVQELVDFANGNSLVDNAHLYPFVVTHDQVSRLFTIKT